MSEDSSHASVRPSSSVTKEAGKRVTARSARKGEPSFHMTEQMRRLSTPWGVALARAGQIDPHSLGPGIILDAYRWIWYTVNCLLKYPEKTFSWGRDRWKSCGSL